ncbi:hypothetical protein CBW65_14735 [Tumebacillus avium]|uniref:Bulb-type lectin domain-containing protein n=1 Tax=Tumebacillus avium TaxID=1903704 RepID=A0A1Y0IRY7_9BACL|nr:hypothetical protein [Tumebacillus avium]ARU62114.1 hypothetical protein CBW65_14735 [Tumebacillus avium]
MKKLAFALLAASMLQLTVSADVFAANNLPAGQSLVKGQSLTSNDGRFTLIMQYDENLVLYHSGNGIWDTDTDGDRFEYYDNFLQRWYYRHPEKLTLTTSGALRVTDASGTISFWQADTKTWQDGYYRIPMAWPGPAVSLAVQDDGNVVMYDAYGRPAWATNTGGR